MSLSSGSGHGQGQAVNDENVDYENYNESDDRLYIFRTVTDSFFEVAY